MSTPENTIKFKYKLASDYKIYSISGLQGTITPAGDLVINCYKERHPLPDSETFQIKETGQLEFINRESASANTIIRDIPFAISINPLQARSFAKWLNAKADEFEQRAVNLSDKLDG